MNQFTDTQVRVGNEDQQKTKRYCTECRIYYSCIPQKETAAAKEDASNLPRSLKCSSLAQIQLNSSDTAHGIPILCGRSKDQSKFIKQEKSARKICNNSKKEGM